MNEVLTQASGFSFAVNYAIPGAIAVAVIVGLYFIIRVLIKLYNRIMDAKRREYVQESSIPLSKLPELNKHCESMFVWGAKTQWDYEYALKSKAQFDGFSPALYLKIALRDNLDEYTNSIQIVAANNNAYAKYRKYCTSLLLQSQIPEPLPRLFKDERQWKAIEREEFINAMLKPPLSLYTRIGWSYTSPAGRNHYCNAAYYGYDQIVDSRLEVLDELRHKECAQYQRSLLTPALRFKVLKRDGYRCCICGRSAADGVQLEVDHIIPVSKGGKTEMSNLQTLCWDCNRGKSDRDM